MGLGLSTPPSSRSEFPEHETCRRDIFIFFLDDCVIQNTETDQALTTDSLVTLFYLSSLFAKVFSALVFHRAFVRKPADRAISHAVASSKSEYVFVWI